MPRSKLDPTNRLTGRPTPRAEPLEPRRLLADLASGRSVVGTIGASGEVDEYTIASSDPGSLFIAIGSTSGSAFKPTVEVDGRTEPPIEDEAGTPSVGLMLFSAGSGTHTIRVSAGSGGSATGSYRFTPFQPDAQQFDDDANDFDDTTDSQPTDSGRRYAATVEPGDIDVWTIEQSYQPENYSLEQVALSENAVGDPIELSLIYYYGLGMTGPFTGDAGLRADAPPSGHFSPRMYAIVTEAGNDDAGVYGFSAAIRAVPTYAGDRDTAPLAAGTPRDGDLPAGDLDVFSVWVDSGETVRFTATAASGSQLDPYVSARNSFGNEVQNFTGALPSDGGRKSVTAEVTPEYGDLYHFILSDTESDDGGRYRVQYERIDDSGVDVVVVEEVLQITATSGDDRIEMYSFSDGNAETHVRINGRWRKYQNVSFDRISVDAGAGDDYLMPRFQYEWGSMLYLQKPLYVLGGDGDDTLNGTYGDDTLRGGLGRNRIYGGFGNDRLDGSGGRDLLFGEDGDDRLYGNRGDDQLDGGGGKDRLYGGEGDDLLIGGASADRLYGEAGRDTLAGGKANDLLNGGDDDDLATGREAGDNLISIEST